MYGYGFAVQLYNDNESKGLKGIELPKGDISFSINLKTERSALGSSELEDITKEATPILWNYRVNSWSTDLTGNIPDRDMFRMTQYNEYIQDLPLGIDVGDRNYSVLNSGNIQIIQEETTLHVTIKNYEIDNEFPLHLCAWEGAISEVRKKIYTDNIGTFSVGYMQIFLPDTEANTVQDRNYYLTLTTNNMNITSKTGELITSQMNSDDDKLTTNHVLYKPGNYEQHVLLYHEDGEALGTSADSGDGHATLGEIIRVRNKFIVEPTNDYDIYTGSKFIKFDGDGFMPVYFSDGTKYFVDSSGIIGAMDGKAEFRVWYVIKKDGSNWISQAEMNNANIEDMDIYDSIEQIPSNQKCIGIYLETISGYLARSSGYNNGVTILLKIKDTATIGQTYGITCRTKMWIEQLDRSIYTVTNPDVQWPTPEWDSGNRNYIKTEYDENSNMVSGTHSGGFQWGNSALVTGGNLVSNIRAVDNNKDKINYDLGLNENIVTYSVEPTLSGNSADIEITDITLKADVTIPRGITYVSGSSTRNGEFYTEPIITNNSDGSTTLVWYLYGITTGRPIDPILFQAQIDKETQNNTQFETKFVISEYVSEGETSKIGNSLVKFRTSTITINITNMATHRLFKEVNTNVIEKNGEIKYTITYQNTTRDSVPNFQLLDILPFNEDSRESKFNGIYTIQDINVTQTSHGVVQNNNNISLYISNSEEARKLNATDTEIGTNSIWKAMQLGNNINETATAVALKGQISGESIVVLEFTIKTQNNKAKDLYVNQAMAQIYVNSEQIVSGNVETRVVYRTIEGTIWEDKNRNNIIDTEEKGLEGFRITLINSNTGARQETLSENDGSYIFENLEKGNYRVQIEDKSPTYELVEKEAGNNIEINSKFNKDTKTTDEITTLNNTNSPLIMERYVNAGLTKNMFNIQTEVEGVGGSISGENENPYEEVEYGKDSTKDIIVTPDKGYKVSKITVNGEPIKFEEEPNHTVRLDKFINMTEDKKVVVTFEQIPATVTIHHYIEGTTDKVPAQNGGVVEDETRSGHVGDIYASERSNTIAPNYEYVSDTGNTSGIMTEEPIEVIYYYQLKQAGIEQKITKQGTPGTITEEDQKVTYNITYTANITDYIGNASITIVDTLPFSIDTSTGKSNLNGGRYDAGQNTITWEETIEDINTFTNEASGQITITKQIEVTYADMDFSKTSFENKVEARIELETTGQEEGPVEDKVTTNTDFRTEVTVTKVWNHTNNIYTIPAQIKVQLKNGENVVQEEVLTEANKVGEDVNKWSYTFTNLPKYDEEGMLIDYTVDEAEVNSGDLAYYDKQISGKTITNTYAGPIISSTKDSTTEKGLEYVVEGEKITYTITVKNNGSRDKVVKVQDSAPEGTTFVAGSIKVNGSGAGNYTETNLNSGIPVNVTTHGTATVSFEVTVNPLEGNNLTKVITNTATVDGKDTDSVTETVNKSKITFNKTSESENRLDYVVEGEKITYTINLSNEGTAPATTLVKDSSPEGTTFTQGSIVVKVDNVQINTDKTYTEEELEQGISVEVPAGKSASVSFTVTVNNLNNATLIKNKATVGDSEEPNTNETEDKYVEPIISSEKTVEIEHPEVGYALEGETIKYTITVTNNGGLSKDVIIKDTVPEGTTFVPGSIEVNGSGADNYTETNLNSGITVNVPAKEGTVAGTASISFEVRVNALESGFTKVIENTAEVDGTPTDEVEVTVNKPNVIASKESTPASGSTVKLNDPIKYVITLTNDGTAPETVTVRDEIPEGTTFSDGSIKVQGDGKTYTIDDLTTYGIDVLVPEKETRTVEFTVTVNDLDNGDKITNIAYVEGEETDPVKHTYVEAIIDGSKASETANGLDYVVEGEVITYTITANNTGDLDKNITISDQIPAGTTFVEESIRVNGEERADLAQTNLSDGIQVNVPARTSETQPGTASISFQVTVNPLDEGIFYKEIENTAIVDGKSTEPVEEIVNKSDVKATKTSVPENESTVKAGETITYTINLTNEGTAPANVTVKDEIPEGTTFKTESIKVNGQGRRDLDEADLESGIQVTVPSKVGETAGTGTVSFEVTVNDNEDGQEIKNKATVNETPTNETIHKYVEPVITQEKSATTEHGLDYVVEGEKITYTITVTNDGGLDKNVVVKDELPAGTTFVEGSIKVNGLPTQDTEDNLKAGITVNVPAKQGDNQGTATVSFDVTVDPLEGEDLANLRREILNTALVDDNPTNEVTETVNKADVKYSKSSIPDAGSIVTANNEITYIITLDNSTGKAPATVVVKDSIPTGTTFVPGSIKVKDSSTGNSAEELASGIEVNLNAGESTTLEFKVTVNDLGNNTQIRNIATVNDTPTNETTHTYVEPIISAEKESTTENGLGYVVEGEKITYTITVRNDGGLSKDVVIKDNAPEGTTFVDGSIKVNGSGDDNYTETDLNSGIKVKVPAKQENDQGTATVSFEVTVNEIEEGFTTTIENTATVDEKPTDEVITTVNKPNVTATKESIPESGETVENGEEITYTIRLTNNGTAEDTVTVKDSIPAGTEFVEGSIKVGSEARPELTEDNLSNGIEVTVEAENTNTLEFKVKVVDNDTLENENKITNTATVNDIPTNEVEHTYIEPIIDATKAQSTENSLDYVVEGEKITYTITVTNTGDLGKDVTVRDNIPAGTTFVPDSIVIVENGTPKEGTFTESNLEDGIEVNVGAQNTTTITFQVTVDELPQGIYQEEIVNAAVVDEEPTEDVRVDVYKPHITATKEAEPAEGTRLTANDPITYTITIRNDGRTDGATTVKDTIPEGTTFVPGSIKVAGESRAELTQENLSQGINVEVAVGEETTVEFQVKVNDLNNGDPIRNVATYTDEDEEEKSTEEVEHTYVEPIINSTKESETENGLAYVVEGETITYTITVTNSGDLGKNVTITDEIPEGTTFVEGSIKIDGESRTELTKENLSQGIQEFVNARDEITLSFDVTVDVLSEGELRKEIVNTALVDNDPTDPVTDIVNKADVKGEKSSVPPSGETVEAGEEITYTITVRNDGTAPKTAIVKDTIPEGTTFVDGSIKVEGSQDTYELADLTTNGIEVPLNPDESKTVEFKVTVQDLSNGTPIRNIATVDDESTNNTEHTYVEPIISGSKSFETENGLDYVVEGETITYIITATNTGDVEGIVKVSDQIPEGTTFVPESIKVGEEARTELTQDNLQEGIDVTVPARGETEVSFQVKVNELAQNTYSGTIENTAHVTGKEYDEDVPSEDVEVKKPNITGTKESDPASGTEVTAEDTITYTIYLSNQGTAPGEVIAKDEIPEDTTFVKGSIKLGGQVQENLTADDLTNGIRVQLNADESTTLEFKVTVNDIDNDTPIKNIASITNPKTSEETPTNETEHTYIEPEISQVKTATTEKGLDYVSEGEKITYTITVTNSGDLGKDVIVRDNIPEGTTFVDGSITVNGEERADLGKTNLSDGITVNIPARTSEEQPGTVTVTFQVTVNPLEGEDLEALTKELRNTAYVDEVPTDEITNEVKKAYVRIGKTSEPASGSKVVVGDEIRYVIVLENTKGTAPITLKVKDSIPEGTTFVEGSILVNDQDLGNTLEDLTTNGITVDISAGETRTVEFRVKVNDLDNGYIIKNKANIMNPETQESKETNEVTHEYVEAIIDAEKEMTTERGLSYVIPGEKVTYTIRVQNKGDLNTTLTVQDSIPEGTEFVEGSVLINGIVSNVTKEQLESGIEVEAIGNSEQTISFTVTVLEGATEIRNTAIVEGTPTNETKVPVVTYEKTAEVIRQTEEDIPEGTVTAGDKLKYTIKVNNLGEEPVTDITIKDVVPTGTTLSKVYNSGTTNDKNEISWTIESIEAKSSAEVSFEVTVNYDVLENKVITNVATVDDEDINETETPYDKAEIKEESTITKTGTEIINSTEDSITYQITYNATIKDFVGKGKVTIVDYLPYEIDVENQYLDGGFYDSKTKTITWEEDLGAIDTYTNGEKKVNIEKEITVKYLYGEDAETLEGTIPNRVEGTLQLTQEDPENPLQDKVVLEDKKEATHETEVQIPTYIIVHHYIEGTNIKVPSKVYGEVVEDERQDGFVGQEYTTSASGNVQENYQVVSNSGNTTGSMTRTPIEVIYYYRLQPGNIVTNTITKDGTDKIVNKDDKVSYTINYTGRITDYVGNAKVEIVDYLPYAIDESLSNLNGGLYNPETKTITWTEDLGRVNTYTDGAKDISLSKNIEVVFTEMNYTETSFINRAQGKITLEETNQEQETPEASKETETEFIKDITVEKVWDDNEDIKGRRPDSVTVQLTADGNTIYNNQELEKVVLSDENSWTYTFQDLPKYTEQGQEISYSVVETETNPGDLEYYEEPVIEVFNTDTTATVRVTNSYKLMDTDLNATIEKTGTDAVASSSQEVNYNIKYNATVTEYIGTGLVTITDYLPYAIDESKSNLDGGTYDALTNTITWTENIDHINTYENGDYPVSIEKNITVVFTNLDATAKAMVNRVTGRINLYENETTNTVETTYETKIEIPGNVIVKYIDKDSGREIAESYELNGLAGDAYTTEQKDIYGYTFVESTNNTSGNMIEGTIEVIYYYERTNAGGVIVHYVDEEGNKLIDDVTIIGKVADPYKTEQKEIPNYDFVRVEGQTEGEMVEGVIEVTYIYKKIPARVIVQHLEKDDTPDDNTDNVVLAEEEIIEGFSGDAYSTERKEIENYKPADPEPENAEGTMTREDIYVTYYYERKPSGIVTVKYVDVDTNEEILHKVELPDGSEEYTSYREQMSGLCGLEYATEQKDIPYYNFVEDLRPTNATGIYTEEDIEVIYYYRKQTFNLSVEKLIDRITVNGVEHNLKDGLDQIDVVASKVQETDIVVTYKIVVSNPSEIAGTATAIESIPDFFRVTDGTSAEWTENGKSLNATVELQPGETKELTVVLRWIKNSNNFGLQVNTVTLQKVENPANYEETDLSDNTAIAEVIFSVKTGGIDLSIVLGTALIVMVGALMITIYLKERKTK